MQLIHREQGAALDNATASGKERPVPSEKYAAPEVSPVAFKGHFYRGARIAVLGATGALGQALTLALLESGVSALYLTGRNLAVLKTLRDKALRRGITCECASLDVTDLTALKATLETAFTRGVQGFFIAFGLAVPMDEDGLERPEDIASCMAVNLVAVGAVLNEVARLKRQARLKARERVTASDTASDKIALAAEGLVQRQPSFISVVTSQAGLMPLPFAPAYSASKVGVNALCEALRGRLKEEGIHLTVVMPGFFTGPMGEQFVGRKHGELSAKEVALRMLRATALEKARVSFPVWQSIALWWGRILPRPIVNLVLPWFEFRTRERKEARS